MDAPLLSEIGIPTVDIADAQEGDAVFCHSRGIVGSSIRFGQYLKRYPSEFRKWSHIAWLDQKVPVLGGGGYWKVGQAVAAGVTNTVNLETLAPNSEYEIVPLSAFPGVVPGPLNREAVLATLRAQVGVEYGFLTIGSEVFNILSPRFLSVDFRKNNTWICSGLYAYGLHSGGGKIPGDLYQIMPAGIAQLAG